MEKNFREKEWSEEEAEKYSQEDFNSDPKEFLKEIYKEANNSEQPADNRIAKLVMKCSALFARLSADQEAISKENIKLQRRVIFLTWALFGLTLLLAVIAGIQTWFLHQQN